MIDLESAKEMGKNNNLQGIRHDKWIDIKTKPSTQKIGFSRVPCLSKNDQSEVLVKQTGFH